jgi:tetratricopeptide (TPR) repeat protein
MLLRLLGQLRGAPAARKDRLSGDGPAASSSQAGVDPAVSEEEEARRAVESTPDSAEAHNNLGVLYSRSNRLEAAEQEFLLASRLQQNNFAAHFNLGKILERTNRLAGAEASYRRAIELKPELAEAHNRLGLVLAASGRHQQAEACYRQALELKPDFSAARDNLASVLEEFERQRETEAALRRALEAAPDSAESHLALGALLSKSKRPDEAISAIRRAAELEPESALTHFRLGVVLQNANRPFEAEIAYRRALELIPDFADAHHNLGLLLAGTRRFEEAEASYRRALASNPDFAGARCSLGMVFEKTCRLSEAEASYRQALAVDAGFEHAQQCLGNLLLEISHRQHAVAACRRDVENFPDEARRHHMLGKALLALGKAEEAAAAFAQALALQPRYAEAHNGLGMSWMMRGELDSAIACFRLAVSSRQDYSRALSNLGAAFLRKGDIAQAATWIHATLAINPGQAEANYQMALIAAASDNLDEANRYFERAVSRAPSIGIEIASNPKRAALVLGMTSRGGNMSPATIDFVFPANSNTRITWAVDLADEDEADNLPYYDLAFNAMGDPDITGDVRRPVDRFLEACAKPVLNHPHRVMLTTRDNLPHMLKGIDNLLVPEVWKFAGSADWDDAMARHLPLLIRPVDTNGGVGLVLARTADELGEARAAQSTPVFVTRFVDFRGGDNLYRKYRAIFVDRQPYPYHLAISPDWMVHYYSAGMETTPWKLEEEQQFLENPEAALGIAGWQAIRSIGARLDLDYAGIDFSMMPDGRVLVFEANTTMLIHPEYLNGPLDHKNVYVYRIAAKFEEMLLGKTAAIMEP